MPRTIRAPLAAAGLLAGGIVAAVLTDRTQGQAPPPAAVPKDLPSYRDVVKKVLPAVVSIEGKSNRRPQPVRRPANIPEQFRPFFDQDDQPQTPNLGFGSGVVIDPAGVVLTNSHVVDGADSVEVTFQDGKKYTSTDVRRDPKSDLAVVRFAADKPVPALTLGDSDAMEVGDRVLAVGAPFGLTGSVTSGIVSAKSRQNLRLNQYEDFLQTDAAMNPGNSGGPLVNLAGEVVGINSAIKSRSGSSSGVGLAVSSNLARDVSQQLLKTGSVRRGYLGVGVRELDADLAARLGVPAGSGVLVTKVYENTPAAKAGLRAGDVIVGLAGQPVKEVTALPRAVAKLPLDQPAEVRFVRDGKEVAQPVTVTAQPDEFGSERFGQVQPQREPPARGQSVAGLTVTDLTPAAAAQLGHPRDTKGVLVTAVDRESATAGLARGAVVVKVDQTPTPTAADFQQAVQAADKEKGALLQVLRPGGEADFVVLKVK